MTHDKALDAWLYGTRIATITDDDGDVALRWTDEAYARWGQGSRVMSDLLPVTRPEEHPHHRRVEVFLENLLPEGNAREHLAFDAGVASDDIFGMIEAYGRDTAGALIFVPAGSAEPTRVGTLNPLSDAEIGAMLEAAGRNAPALGAEPHLQSTSLAGVQPKIVLAKTRTGWARCIDGYPSTHIAKLAHPPGSAVEDVVHTEVACLHLAKAIGLTTISAELMNFSGQLAIVVSRYDRLTGDDGAVNRIHQEDSAQALGINTSDPARKFQRGKQIPSLAKIARVLRNGGSEPDRLLELTTFNLAVGNTDAHAKNISLIRHLDGSAQLAPAYDVAMHLHHQNADRVFAMDVNSKMSIDEISVADLITEAELWPLPHRRAVRTVAETLQRLDYALTSTDTTAYPGIPELAWEMVTARTRELLKGVPALSRTSTSQTGVRRASQQARRPKGKPRGGQFAPPNPPATEN
jgi:serine/threonine-protein kinase HipA